MNPAPPGWSDPNAAPAASPRTNTILTVAAVVLTAVVLGTMIGVVLTHRETILDKRATQRAIVTLIAANSPAGEPFMTAHSAPTVSVSAAAVEAIRTATTGLPVSPDRGVRLVSGARAGLYGGTGDPTPCDAPTLANYLDAHRGRAQVWGAVQKLHPDEIPYYLNTLTPVVLTVDTWVTSYGYGADGHATQTQAVLQAGSAVMIDPAGVPRVRCAGAHPLTPPANVSFAELSAVGAPWPGYEPQSVVAVAYSNGPASFSDPAPTAPVGSFTLTDLGSGQPVSRTVGATIDLSSAPGLTTMLPDPIAANEPDPSHP